MMSEKLLSQILYLVSTPFPFMHWWMSIFISGLEAVRHEVPRSPMSTGSSSPRRLSVVSDADETKLSRLHDLFGYHGRPTRSSAGSVNSNPPANTRFSGTSDPDNTLKNT